MGEETSNQHLIGNRKQSDDAYILYHFFIFLKKLIIFYMSNRMSLCGYCRAIYITKVQPSLGWTAMN